MNVVPDPSRPAMPWWRPAAGSGDAQRTLGGFTVAASGPAPGTANGGPNVYLVHGMVDASDTWAPLLPALAGCNVWRLDLPWSGRDGAGWPGRAPALAWLREALALCPPGPGIFIGHSFGATALLEWLATDPDAPLDGSAALLLAPFCCAAGRKVGWDDIDAYARGVPRRFEQALRARMGAAVPADDVLRAMAGKLAERVMPDGLLELFRVFLASRQWPLGRLRLPLEIVVGEDDGALAHDSARALAGAVPDARLHALPGCGHYSMHEQPEAVRALAAGLLRTLMPSRGEAA